MIEESKEIIGYTTFMKQFSTWDANFYIYLDCLFIKEKARGKGLGMFIMERVKEYAKSKNCKIIQWQTPDFNQKTINFYQKLGAVSKSKERFFWNV
ncbi:GNAT family N-acetyltransferase [Aquimarina longa]|uniref:GNAT family N-acetyltransferase n=1 Tax=Aquimarina longa TaxID=1080221 RepID=UPI000AE1C571|nr:GNAT family N-acetyltransferase [Aquimarina longa]